ncbi:SAM-dependent methyltransferase [Schlesneria paludicola]|uniref:SAM-dependent methyltransferase n=1 Tax=Schlesneria paludicola TaxID=360056 RepID=UPI000299F116|nr:cyclopropane-fatty-acyl-phospholipid synthase family protein [Schlesneria paludicola]
MSALKTGIEAIERGWVPDAVTRLAIRRLCTSFLGASDDADPNANEAFLASLQAGPIALSTDAANEQHYELPPEFFTKVLGPHRKYSCCYFSSPHTSLDEAERAALEITCDHAELRDGQAILELGCGWGSLSLWMSEHYPNSRIVSVSNSHKQRQFIESEAAARGLRNLRVVTADINDFTLVDNNLEIRAFDRVVSVEMFEHMHNFDELLFRISRWLAPTGKLFVHHFCHHVRRYPFETNGDVNWMGRYFFTGGIMPDERLLENFSRDLIVTRRWTWDGQHYERTSNAWLNNLDRNRAEILPILEQTYGAVAGRRWLHRWRMFFIAVAELFGLAHGCQWYVTHALLEHRK